MVSFSGLTRLQQLTLILFAIVVANWVLVSAIGYSIIGSPAGSSTLSATIRVSATASDNVGVAGVQFKLDGANLGAEVTTASQYSTSWNRTTASNGSQTLTAIARDAAGKRTKSTTVTMTVANNQTAVASGSSTTPGTLSLSSTFDAISVRATFLNDPNGNNSATVQFRKQRDATWKNAYTPIVDRRTSISGQPNPYVHQVRGSIVGLEAGTTYEVALTFADPDGVSGNPTLTGTVATIAPAPPLSGNQIFVDDVAVNGDGSSASPFNSIPNALNAATAGDTIHVMPGTYPPFTVSKSGTASGYIAIVGESRDQVFISGGSGNNITVNGNYIQLKNLRLKQSSHNSIEVQGRHHVWIDNLYHENISSSRSYDDAGVIILSGSHNVYVLNNQFYSQSLLNAPAANPRWDSPGEAIYIAGNMDSQGTFVFKGNIIDGGFRDCIGNSPEGWGGGINNSDIAYNTITNCKDDAIQMEGDDVNLRIYGNNVTANNGYSAVAMAPHLVGPVYVFRNVFRENWNGDGGYAFKLESSPGFAFYIHNTIDTTGSSQQHDGWAGVGPDQYLFNNIIKTSGNPLYSVLSAGVFNANLYFRTTSGPVVSSYGSANYSTVSAFRNATGQEQQGRQGDPAFVDGAKHITASSPAFDAGIVIPNFNDAASAWPYKGAAPDMGAYELP